MLLKFVVISLLSGSAIAAPWAEVDAIWAPDESGKWRRVDQSGSAILVEGEKEQVLSVGQDLEKGDQIKTTQARVRIRLSKKGQMVVRPNSELVLTERGTLQKIGEVFYSVEGAFRVQYRSVEAAVEGTQFVVGDTANSEAVEVRVGEGRVRVASASESVLVRAGERTEVSAGSVPVAPSIMASTLLKDFKSVRRHVGLPSSSVAILNTQRIEGGALAWDTGLRIQGRVRLAPGIRALFETGFASDLERFHLKESAGVEAAVGPIGLALSTDLLLGEMTDCVGETQFGAKIGASGMMRVRIPLPHDVAIESQLRLAYDGAVSGELGLGVSFGL